MTLTRVQREVLSAIVEETRRRGMPMMLSEIRALMGRDPAHTIRELKALGCLMQTVDGGPYVPVIDLEGRSLRLTLVHDESKSKENGV
jgi:predicted transcriptional regulator